MTTFDRSVAGISPYADRSSPPSNRSKFVQDRPVRDEFLWFGSPEYPPEERRMPEYSRPPIDRTRLCLFYALAYSLTWAFTIPFVYVWLNITHHRLERWMIVFLPGAYGPSFAAIIVTAMTDGRAGVRRLLGKLLLWRFPAVWWTFGHVWAIR